MDEAPDHWPELRLAAQPAILWVGCFFRLAQTERVLPIQASV